MSGQFREDRAGHGAGCVFQGAAADPRVRIAQPDAAALDGITKLPALVGDKWPARVRGNPIPNQRKIFLCHGLKQTHFVPASTPYCRLLKRLSEDA